MKRGLLKPTPKEIKRDAKMLRHAIDYMIRLNGLVTTEEAKKAVNDSIFEMRLAIEAIESMKDNR